MSLIDAVEWGATPLGPRSAWPPSLTTSSSIISGSAMPMAILWGDELTLLYNASFIPVLGERHPQVLGRRLRDVWPELSQQLQPHLPLEGAVTIDVNGPSPGRTQLACTPIVDADGCRGVFVAAIAHTDRRALRTIADAMPQIVCTVELDGRVEYFNRHWFAFTGLNETETFARAGWTSAIHPHDRRPLRKRWREAAAIGADFSIEARIRSSDGEYRWFLARALALHDDEGTIRRFFATATDIDDQKRAEERETFLSHVSEALTAATLDVRTTLQTITELCVPAFADWCQVQSISGDDTLVVEAVRHSDPELDKRLQQLVGRNVVPNRNAAFGSPAVLRKTQSRVLNHEATLDVMRENVPNAADRDIYEAAGLGTALIVPLVARGETRGTLHLVNVDPTSSRSEITIDVAEELARRAALAIDNSRLYEREHRVASALQQAMLPARLPSHERIELSYAYRPAEQEAQVGGDWYDAFAISEHRIAISIGDVGGHGLEAAIAMNEARQALRLCALEGVSPAETLKRTNAALMLNENGPLITAIFGVIDIERSTFRYSCAGHPPPALAPISGGARYLAGGGIPMGIRSGESFPTHEIALEPYATLLLYTDGLIEFGRNLERESGRLLEALGNKVQDASPNGAAMLVKHVLNNRQFDDIAVLAATILPVRPASVELRLPALPSSATIARRFVTRFSRVGHLGPSRTFELTMTVGEAVANAVEHAYRGGTVGHFMLRLAMDEDRVVGEVQDFGAWRQAASSAERGRGLRILRATTRALELNRSRNGTTVKFAV